MGKLPLLTPREVESRLKALGFVFKNQVGSHKQYEKAATPSRKRAVVTVDVAHSQFSKGTMKRMIRQSFYSQDEFCSGVAKDSIPKPVVLEEAPVSPKTGQGGES